MPWKVKYETPTAASIPSTVVPPNQDSGHQFERREHSEIDRDTYPEPAHGGPPPRAEDESHDIAGNRDDR